MSSFRLSLVLEIKVTSQPTADESSPTSHYNHHLSGLRRNHLRDSRTSCMAIQNQIIHAAVEPRAILRPMLSTKATSCPAIQERAGRAIANPPLSFAGVTRGRLVYRSMLLQAKFQVRRLRPKQGIVPPFLPVTDPEYG